MFILEDNLNKKIKNNQQYKKFKEFCLDLAHNIFETQKVEFYHQSSFFEVFHCTINLLTDDKILMFQTKGLTNINLKVLSKENIKLSENYIDDLPMNQEFVFQTISSQLQQIFSHRKTLK